MKKYCLVLLFVCISNMLNAQIPFTAEPLGKGKNFVYFEFVSRPGVNEQSIYTYWQHGFTNWLDMGFDLESAADYHAMSFTLKPGYIFSKWFGVGAMIQPWFTTSENFAYEGMLNTLIMQGAITQNEALVWSSNTYLGFGAEYKDYYYQQLSIGLNLPLGENDLIVPMGGIMTSLRFDEDISPNFGVAYYHKRFGAYLFGNELGGEHPQLLVALEFKF